MAFRVEKIRRNKITALSDRGAFWWCINSLLWGRGGALSMLTSLVLSRVTRFPVVVLWSGVGRLEFPTKTLWSAPVYICGGA